MRIFYPLLFLIAFLQSFETEAQGNFDLPANIKLSESKGMIEFYPGTQSCVEDLEQYIDIINSPELTKSYENLNSMGRVSTGFIIGFSFLTLMSESAALGQIGQDDGRGKIYAMSGVAAIVGACITGSVHRLNRYRRIKKVVKLYNEIVEEGDF